MTDPAAAVVAVKRIVMFRKVLAVGGKVAVTCICFWYVFRQTKIDELLHDAANLDARWLILAIIFAAIQLPLVGVRWAWIIEALDLEALPAPLSAIVAINMIGSFFAQVLPNVVSDAVRIWLLTQIRPGWRKGLIGVLIDRGVGVCVLLAIGLVTLASPSNFTGLSEYRITVLTIFAALLIAGIIGLVCVPIYAPLLARFRATNWFAEFALASRRVLIKSPAAIAIVAIAIIVHASSIVDIWCLGRAFSMPLGIVGAATLFTLIVAIALIPITVNGWGLRELAVTAFLSSQGIPSQQALLFSICFGMTLLVAALPGAIVLVFYSSERVRHADLPHRGRELLGRD